MNREEWNSLQIFGSCRNSVVMQPEQLILIREVENDIRNDLVVSTEDPKVISGMIKVIKHELDDIIYINEADTWYKVQTFFS